ncbi:MAG: AAA family ATPase [Nitrospiraceae bacterium]|nr:AAA family ATPase [Nitrospiraceae bacterium]
MRNQEETIALCKALFPDSDDVRTLLKICPDRNIAQQFYRWYTAPARRATSSVSLLDIAAATEDTTDDEFPEHDVIKLGPDDKGYTYYVDRESNEIIKKTRTVVPITPQEPVAYDTDESIWYSLIQSISGKYSGLEDMKDRRTFLSDISGVMNKASDRTIRLYHSVLAVVGFIGVDTVLAILSARSGTAQSAEKQGVFIESLYSLPIGITKPIVADMKKVREVLEASLFGLAEVKERINEYVAIMIHSRMQGSPVPLLLVGPPGIGKTSIAKAIAEALGLPFHSFNLGGASDNAVFRGHHSSWSESTPGGIVRMLINAGCENPVVLLDEIDKAGESSHGMIQDIVSELVDPSTNCRFMDNYMGFPINLGRCLYILTANDKRRIPDYLLDRCELIDIREYTASERAEIIEKHLVMQVLVENFLECQVSVEKEMVDKLSLIPSLREVKRILRSAIARALAKMSPEEATTIKLGIGQIEVKKTHGKPFMGFTPSNR